MGPDPEPGPSWDLQERVRGTQPYCKEAEEEPVIIVWKLREDYKWIKSVGHWVEGQIKQWFVFRGQVTAPKYVLLLWKICREKTYRIKDRCCSPIAPPLLSMHSRRQTLQHHSDGCPPLA